MSASSSPSGRSPDRDRDAEARDRAARRAAASRGGRSSERGSRPAKTGRRRGIPILVAIVIGVLALGIGLFVGYASRGDRAPAGLETVEVPLRVVTVTVEGPVTPPASTAP